MRMYIVFLKNTILLLMSQRFIGKTPNPQERNIMSDKKFIHHIKRGLQNEI